MNPLCMTYLELADFLNLSPGTVRNNWRSYPHFFVTPTSFKSENLRGARFNQDDILQYFKILTENSDGNTRNREKEWNRVPSILQVSGAPVLKDLLQPKRGKGMGASRKSGPKSAASYATEFDVFPC